MRFDQPTHEPEPVAKPAEIARRHRTPVSFEKAKLIRRTNAVMGWRWIRSDAAWQLVSIEERFDLE
jgi:hypothetical protein